MQSSAVEDWKLFLSLLSYKQTRFPTMGDIPITMVGISLSSLGEVPYSLTDVNIVAIRTFR